MSDLPSSPAADEVADRPAPGLRLDARQRAMLDEMGVKVWWPAQRTSPVAGAAEVADAGIAPRPRGVAQPAASPAVAGRAPARPPATAPAASTTAIVPRGPDARPAPAALPPTSAPARAPGTGPAAPARSPASSSSHGVPDVAFDAPLRLYAALDEDGIAPPPQGGWLVVADMPPEADGHHGEPFAGEAGRLLDNMLRALRLHEGRMPVHLMRTHRAGPAASAPGRGTAAPSAGADFAALAGALAPRIVLALGPLAAQGLLQSAEPLGRLRGRAAPLRIAPDGPLDGLPVVVTYPPAYLLRNPADKARAWADLCLAADRLETPPA